MDIALRISTLALAGTLFVPLVSFGAGTDYARVTEHTDSEVLVKRNSLTDEAYYRCSILSGECRAVASTTSILPPGANSVPPYMLAYRQLLPSGASSLVRSPDGRYIAFYIPATESRKERTFGVLDTTNLSIYTKVEAVSYWDLLSEGLLRYYHFSPDSKTFLYLDDVADEPTLYKVDLASLSGNGGALPSTRLFSREYSMVDVVFKDNDSIFYIANRDNPYAWALYELSLSDYSLEKIADDVSYADPLWLLAGGTKLVFTKNDGHGVYPMRYDLVSGSVEAFSFPEWSALETDGVHVTTLTNDLHGAFFLESSGRSDTLLVWLHGGPYRQASTGYHPYWSYGGYDWVLEKLRHADVGILKLDYPGSAGFGRLYAESITGGIGTEDATRSRAAIADFAKRNGYSKIYLMGNSYGGYLALKLLVDNPEGYRGAFSINGVADWLTLLTQLDTSIFNVQFHGTVSDTNRDAYQRASIYNYADRLGNQKIVLMHGAEDRTIPVSQSEGLASYLASNGANSTLITLAGEDHIFRKPESYEVLCRAAFSLVERNENGACDL